MILTSHRIDAEALRRDDFDTFYSKRKKALIELIEDAMGKGAAISALSGDFVSDEEPFDEYVLE